MAKKIGFIDYYLDEWHANQYPRMFQKWTEGFEVACAYGMIDSPHAGGLTSKASISLWNILDCLNLYSVLLSILL